MADLDSLFPLSTDRGAQPDVITGHHDRRELVEDLLKLPSDEEAKRAFQKGPWKNYFLVESHCGTLSCQGTAFLTDLEHQETVDGEERDYVTLLTAAHCVFGFDVVRLKHSSELLTATKDTPVESIPDFITLHKQNKAKGSFQVCSTYNGTDDDVGPSDYAAIYINKNHFSQMMEMNGMSLASGLFSINEKPKKKETVFVAGYPSQLSGYTRTHLVYSNCEYQPRDSLSATTLQKEPWTKDNVDGHRADTTGGESGAPVVLGKAISPSAQREVTAIHVGGNANEKMNAAIPITPELLSNLRLKQPGKEPVGERKRQRSPSGRSDESSAKKCKTKGVPLTSSNRLLKKIAQHFTDQNKTTGLATYLLDKPELPGGGPGFIKTNKEIGSQPDWIDMAHKVLIKWCEMCEEQADGYILWEVMKDVLPSAARIFEKDLKKEDQDLSQEDEATRIEYRRQ